MTLFLQFLFCLVVAALIAFRFYWYGRQDGVEIGRRYSNTRYETGKGDGYAAGYAQGLNDAFEAGKTVGRAESSQGAYDAGYKDGWAYRNKRMGGGS